MNTGIRTFQYTASRTRVRNIVFFVLARSALNYANFMPNTLPRRRRRRDETVESRLVGGVNTPVGSRAVLTTEK